MTRLHSVLNFVLQILLTVLGGPTRARHQAPAIEASPLWTVSRVVLSDVRSAAHYGLKSDVAPSPKGAQ